jgi:hypothetical protein
LQSQEEEKTIVKTKNKWGLLFVASQKVRNEEKEIINMKKVLC